MGRLPAATARMAATSEVFEAVLMPSSVVGHGHVEPTVEVVGEVLEVVEGTG